MPNPEVWVYLALIPALIALYLSWFFYRRFTKNRELKTLLWAQLCAFPAAFLLVRLLEAAGLVAGRAADYLYLVMAVLIFTAGIFLRSRYDPSPQRRKAPGRVTAKKSPANKKAGASGKSTAGAKSSAKGKAKKRKGK